MGVWRKLRVLAGALVHKPFMPKQEKVDLDKGARAPVGEGAPHRQSGVDAQEPDVSDGERVADLIARVQQEQAD